MPRSSKWLRRYSRSFLPTPFPRQEGRTASHAIRAEPLSLVRPMIYPKIFSSCWATINSSGYFWKYRSRGRGLPSKRDSFSIFLIACKSPRENFLTCIIQVPRAGFEPARHCWHCPSNSCVYQFRHLGKWLRCLAFFRGFFFLVIFFGGLSFRFFDHNANFFSPKSSFLSFRLP